MTPIGLLAQIWQHVELHEIADGLERAARAGRVQLAEQDFADISHSQWFFRAESKKEKCLSAELLFVSRREEKLFSDVFLESDTLAV